jgi:hypothetical protein
MYITLLMYMLMTCSVKGAPSDLDKDGTEHLRMLYY